MTTDPLSRWTPVPIGDDVQVSNSGFTRKTAPVAAALPDGGFVITWMDYAVDGHDWGIFGQRFNADGSPAGAGFQVATTTSGGQLNSSVAALTDGGYVVTWSGPDQSSGSFMIYGRRYASDGSAVTGEFIIGAGTGAQASATGLPDGGFLVTWNFGGAQRYDVDGNPVDGWSSPALFTPMTAVLADGSLVLAWSILNGIYAQRYAADGTALDDAFQVGGAGLSPSVIALCDGGFAISWTSGGDVFARSYAADGTPAGGGVRVNSYTASDQFYASTAALADGGFMVTWFSLGQDGSDYGSYGQRFTADGTPMGLEFRINQVTQGDQVAERLVGGQSVVTLADGRLVQVWYNVDVGNRVLGEVYYHLIEVPSADGLAAPAITAIPEQDDGTLNAADAVDGTLVTVSLAGTHVIVGDLLTVRWGSAATTPRALTDADLSAGFVTVLVDATAIASQGSGTVTVTAALTDEAGTGQVVSSGVPVAVDLAAPTIAIATIAGDDIVSAAEAAAGVVIAGTTSGAEDGRLVTIGILEPDDTVVATFTTTVSSGAWSLSITAAEVAGLTEGSHRVTADVTDAVGNPAVPAGRTFLVDRVPPAPPTIVSIADSGDGGINAAEAADGSAVVVSVAGTGAQAGDVLTLNWRAHTMSVTLTADDVANGSITVAVSSGVIAGQGDGTFDVSAHLTDVVGNVGSSAVPVAVTVDSGAPGVAIAVITGDGTVDESERAAGFTINGTTSGVEDGREVTVRVVDGNGALVTSFVPTVADDAWTIVVDAATAQLLAHGTYRLTADVSDAAGNAATQAARAFSVYLPTPDMPVPIGDQVEVAAGTHPAVAVLVDGSFVVAWVPPLNAGAGMGTFVRRFASDGSPLGEAVLANTESSGYQRLPNVTALADGGFLVTWDTVGGDGLRGQRYGTDSAAIGGELALGVEMGDALDHSIVALVDGGYVVFYKYINFTTFALGMQGQRYAADGTPQGDTMLLDNGSNPAFDEPAVARLPDGSLVVAWWSGTTSFGGNIVAQCFAADGTTDGVTVVSAGSRFVDPGRHPAVATLADGGFVIAYRKGTVGDIHGQRYAADGTAQGSEFRANSYTTGDQSMPSVTALPDGGFVVTWQSNGQDGDGYGVYGQRFAGDATRLGGEFRINQATAGNQSLSDGQTVLNGNSQIVALADGRLVQMFVDNGMVAYRVIEVPDYPSARLTVDRLVDGSELHASAFSLRGLPAGATAVVTFSDGLHTVSSAILNAGGSYSIDLSSLNDGPLSAQAAMSVHGNTAASTAVPLLLNRSDSLSLTLAEWKSFGAAQQANHHAFSSVSLTGSIGSLQALAPAAIATLGLQGVTDIDVGSSLLTLSVAQLQAFLDAGVDLADGAIVRLRDNEAALKAVLRSDLAAAGIDQVDATGNLLTVDLADLSALGTVKLAANDKVTLSDTGDALAALGAAGVGLLQGLGIDYLQANDGVLRLDLAELRALGAVRLVAADDITLADTGATLAGLSVGEFRGLAGKRVDGLDASDGELSLGLGQFAGLGGVEISSGVALTVIGDAAAPNRFDFSRQTFGDDDRVVGGAGDDYLILNGDQTIAFGSNALSSIDRLVVRQGGHYDLTMDDGNVAAGHTLIVNAAALSGGDSVVFDGSAERDAAFNFLSGGTSSFTGGAGNDLVRVQGDGNWLAGGGGADRLTLGSGHDTVAFAAVSDSTGASYDTVVGFDAGTDTFDLWEGLSVAAMDARITEGLLRTGATFDALFEAAVDDSGLQAGHAVLFAADRGNLAGVEFLVVDANDTAGYQAGEDLLFRLTAATGDLLLGNLI
jgi:hypothetical protein